MNKNIQSKEEVLKDFQALLQEQKNHLARIATKEEIAQKESQKELVELASQHSSDSIIKGLADLQLDFDASVEGLTDTLKAELEKLTQLKTAFEVETAHLQEVQNTKIAADALYILKKEQEATEKAFLEEKEEKIKNLEKEIAKRKTAWEKEQAEHEIFIKERSEGLVREREKELADYAYNLERDHKIEQDEYEERKKVLNRELLDTDKSKNKDWNKRQKTLNAQKDEFTKYKEAVDGFESKLEEETKKARNKAIQEANKDAKNKAELLQKEFEGQIKVYELQIQTLESSIEKNHADIEKLSTELKDALAQVQSLSVKALEKK